MSSPELSGSSGTPGLLSRARALLTGRKLPGWAIVLLAIVTWVPDWASRIKFWLEVVQSMGDWFGIIATIINSPYFSPGLFIIGLAYLAFVGEAPRGIQRHSWWPYVGWSVFGICLTAIIVTAGYGAIELYVRSEIAERQAKLLGDGSDPSAPRQAPDPKFDYNRRLSPDQYRALVEVGPRLKSFIDSENQLYIAVTPGDIEAGSYRRQFMSALTRAGVRSRDMAASPEGPQDIGVMIVVRDITQPPPMAEELRRILEIIGVSARYVEKPRAEKNFYLYIGPKPI
jgi:hypothetical protein